MGYYMLICTKHENCYSNSSLWMPNSFYNNLVQNIHQHYIVIQLRTWREGGGGCCRAADSFNKPKFKDHVFCRHDVFKYFKQFTLQSKLGTDFEQYFRILKNTSKVE
jgi:hypothetical protein